ncbi:MAG: hypothetical protein WDN69_23690 [Aliidongia sp.]
MLLGKPATIFASVVNAGTAALNNCQIALPVTSPAGLSLTYQTTNSTTNALTGTVNTPATIAGNNGVQSFLVTFQGKTAFSATDLPLDFDCLGAGPAAIETGVDTVDLTFSSTAIADIIALSATPTNDGIAQIPSSGERRLCRGQHQCRRQLVHHRGGRYRRCDAARDADHLPVEPEHRRLPLGCRQLRHGELHRRQHADLLRVPGIQRPDRARPGEFPPVRSLQGRQRHAARLDQRRGRDSIRARLAQRA